MEQNDNRNSREDEGNGGTQEDQGRDEGGDDTSRIVDESVDGTEDGSVNAAAGGGAAEGGDDGNGDGNGSFSGLNGTLISTISKEPRKLQRPIQRGAQACEWTFSPSNGQVFRLVLVLTAVCALTTAPSQTPTTITAISTTTYYNTGSQCRNHKIKCVPSSSESPFPCSRCVHQGLTCE